MYVIFKDDTRGNIMRIVCVTDKENMAEDICKYLNKQYGKTVLPAFHYTDVPIKNMNGGWKELVS